MNEAEINIPSLMRKARIAVSKENYEEASGHYCTLLQDPEMKDQLDLKTRYAFCLEKMGELHAAADVNQEIVEAYKSSGEVGAAKALELKISIIRKLADQEEADSDDDAIAATDSSIFDIDTQEIIPLEAEDEPSALAADTQEIIPPETGEETGEKVGQSEAEDIPVTVAPVTEQVEETEVAFEASMMSENAEPEVTEKKKKGEKAIEEISGLIKEGIKKNLAARPGTQMTDIELIHLKGYNANNLELDEDYKKKQAREELSETETATDLRLKLKASQVFGTKPKK